MRASTGYRRLRRPGPDILPRIHRPPGGGPSGGSLGRCTSLLRYVLDVDNGERFQTFAIEGDPGSGTLQVNGAAARLVHPGDTVIVLTYAQYEEGELAGAEPFVVRVDRSNRIV